LNIIERLRLKFPYRPIGKNNPVTDV